MNNLVSISYGDKEKFEQIIIPKFLATFSSVSISYGDKEKFEQIQPLIQPILFDNHVSISYGDKEKFEREMV